MTNGGAPLEKEGNVWRIVKLLNHDKAGFKQLLFPVTASRSMAGIPLVYCKMVCHVGGVFTQCTVNHMGAQLEASGWEYISTIMFSSNVNDFHDGFHGVDNKVARAASKIIRVVLFASCNKF